MTPSDEQETSGPAREFLDLYEGVAPALVTWARLRLGASARRFVEPEELVQEVWVRALARFDTFDPEKGSFRAWVFGIATYVMVEVLRKVARGVARKPRPDVTSIRPSKVADGATAISRRAARDEVLRSFTRSVSQLPDDERSLLIYRGLEGLSHDEVAERLGLKRDAVMKRWQRLKDKLLQESLPAGFLEA